MQIKTKEHLSEYTAEDKINIKKKVAIGKEEVFIIKISVSLGDRIIINKYASKKTVLKYLMPKQI